MSTIANLSKSGLAVFASTLMIGALAFGSGLAAAAASNVTLSGAQEVPPVTTSAKGEGTFTVEADRSVTGSINTSGIDATMAHIHEAASGKNGPPIITLEKKSDNQWVVPQNSMLTEAQYKAYQEGNLYVNVHSDAHKGGEIRDQLNP